jgi:hypothetical protein
MKNPKSVNPCGACGQPFAPRSASSTVCPTCRGLTVQRSRKRYQDLLRRHPGEAGLPDALRTRRDVGEILNLTVERVRQVERAALLKLRLGLLPVVRDMGIVLPSVEAFAKTARAGIPTPTPSRIRPAPEEVSGMHLVTSAQRTIIAELEELAGLYEPEQPEIAADIRLARDELVNSLTLVSSKRRGSMGKDASAFHRPLHWSEENESPPGRPRCVLALGPATVGGNHRRQSEIAPDVAWGAEREPQLPNPGGPGDPFGALLAATRSEEHQCWGDPADGR